MSVLEASELPCVLVTSRLIELKAAVRRSGADGQELFSKETPACRPVFSHYLHTSLSASSVRLIIPTFSEPAEVCLEGFTPDFGTSLAWPTVCVPNHPKGVGWGRAAGQSSSITPNLENHFFMDLSLCLGELSC